MAIIFELWAECRNKETTYLFANHFDGLEHKLLTGRTIKWVAQVMKPPSYPLAVIVSSADLSSYGVRTMQDALETTEAGLHLYHHLKTAPDFRFVRVAWEAGILPITELSEYVDIAANGERHLRLECVVDNELFKQLGSPRFFHQFRNGYWWNRYRGETYRPLYSNDQPELNELCRQLLPEYFSY